MRNITPIPGSLTLDSARDGMQNVAPRTGIQHILICLDRSQLSENSVAYARFVASSFDAKITVLHVMETDDRSVDQGRADALEWEITRREAEDFVSRIRMSLESLGHSANHVDSITAQGHAAERIVSIAREIGADLTILGSRGAHSGGAAHLGRTAHQVLQLDPGSILMAHPASPTVRVPPTRIMVPLDGSLRTEFVLPAAVQLAKHHAAELILVHVVKEPTPTAVLFNPEDVRFAQSLATRVHANAERYLDGLTARLARELPGVESRVIRRADQRRALLDAASEERADLIVLAAHGRTCNIEQAFGSVASYVIANAQVPVLVLQDTPATQNGTVRSVPSELSRIPTSTRVSEES